jgi:hypothetical protein
LGTWFIKQEEPTLSTQKSGNEKPVFLTHGQSPGWSVPGNVQSDCTERPTYHFSHSLDFPAKIFQAKGAFTRNCWAEHLGLGVLQNYGGVLIVDFNISLDPF